MLLSEVQIFEIEDEQAEVFSYIQFFYNAIVDTRVYRLHDARSLKL